MVPHRGGWLIECSVGHLSQGRGSSEMSMDQTRQTQVRGGKGRLRRCVWVEVRARVIRCMLPHVHAEGTRLELCLSLERDREEWG